MGMKDFANNYKYPLVALAFLLIIYGFFLQNNDVLSNITGYAVAPASSLSSSTSSCTSTKVSWSRSTSTGTIYYIVFYSIYSTFPNSYTKSSSATTGSSRTLSGLPPGIKYYYKVFAYPSTSMAQGSWSSSKSFTQSCKPTGLLATSIDCHSEKLTWTAPTGGGVSGYYVAASTSSSFPGSYPYTTTSTSYTLTGLNPSTLYYAKVAGYALGGSDTSSVISFTTPSCSSISAPTLNPAQIKDCSTVYFSWSSVSNAGGYVLYYDTSSSFSAPTSVMLSPTTNYYTATGLKGGNNYYWKVYAFSANDYYNGATSSVQTTGTLPTCTQVTAPTNLKAVLNPATCSIDFSWTKSNAVNYRLDMAFSKTELEQSVMSYILRGPTVTGSSYSWTGLSSMWYYWRIYAYSGDVNAGNGVYTPTQGYVELNCASKPAISTSSVTIYGDEVRLWYAINNRRASLGIKQLAYDVALNRAAEQRANHLLSMVFEHTEPDGKMFDYYLNYYGVSWPTAAGENIGRNNNAADPVGQVFADFCASTGHDANQRNTLCTRMAVAEAVGLLSPDGKIAPYNFAVEFVG